ALSHCWGKPQPDKLQPDEVVVSDPTISAADLPLTFRDAVKVARGLGVQYLWINSLCITQRQNGNWKQESKRMQEVYTSAYYTVATTSA
ncbi:heterokaryon incompatibility, partial [Leptodontidium sp. 2 PMI_412]